MTTFVLLIDGVGRPKLLALPGGDLPPFVGFAHEGVKSGPGRLVKFDYCPDVDLDGRAIYRLAGKGMPAIRYEYLPKQSIGPFNQPRTS